MTCLSTSETCQRQGQLGLFANPATLNTAVGGESVSSPPPPPPNIDCLLFTQFCCSVGTVVSQQAVAAFASAGPRCNATFVFLHCVSGKHAAPTDSIAMLKEVFLPSTRFA